AKLRESLRRDDLAHLVLVENPAHHPGGDFVLRDGRIVDDDPAATEAGRLTFSGVGVYRPDLFAGCRDGVFRLAPLLRTAARQGRLGGEVHDGDWIDIGTPERLAELDRRLGRAVRR
ncbi:MAG TPA: hypothetical protein PK163_07850, partial [Steroidobacteraceae bacterium]|nr:hypothetical protein [Steroidobacteraceae bacterium]